MALISALCVGTAWWFPGEIPGALLAWLGMGFLLLTLLQAERPYLCAYISGVLTSCLGFYWLAGTISEFGGFSPPATALIFTGFTLFNALQYLICSFLFLNLPVGLDRFALRLSLAWTAAEFLTVRIFPWQIGHTQLAFLPFVQIADLAGAQLVSFLLCWITEALVRFCYLKERHLRMLAPALAGAAALAYGFFTIHAIKKIEGPTQTVALVQANLTIAEKHDIKYFKQNTARYLALSKEARRHKPNLLIIWPETVLQEWIPAEVGHVKHDSRVPYLGEDAALLLGTFSVENNRYLFNSAMAVLPDGSVPPPYHKRILMPFGEYMPFATWLPWIQSLNPGAANFSSGSSAGVFNIPIMDALTETKVLKVAPLICYEDVVQSLAREAVLAGAELLVNLTNDAWFGRSVAPYQHHQIAAFRSIENRRYLLRSTNSGLTAVVDATGATTASIPPFSEGVLFADLQPFSVRTIYSRIGDLPWWLLSLGCVAAAVLQCTRRKLTR
ncbi:MAG: apolipoprotein N-acyltransferase [Deltaproteobacteria bacterium]|nr:apolipoprotein N-acyltransferase [Deltaproteobacteria bacterium]